MANLYAVDGRDDWRGKKTGLTREQLVAALLKHGICEVREIRFDKPPAIGKGRTAQLSGPQVLSLWLEVTRKSKQTPDPSTKAPTTPT